MKLYSRTPEYAAAFFREHPKHMDVSENSGTPKSSILIGFSIINHPFWGNTIFGNTHMSYRKRNLQLLQKPRENNDLSYQSPSRKETYRKDRCNKSRWLILIMKRENVCKCKGSKAPENWEWDLPMVKMQLIGPKIIFAFFVA